MRTRKVAALATLAWLWGGVGARAEEPTAKELPPGIEIARHINARDDGAQVTRTLEMVLVDKRGGRRERTARVLRRWFGKEKRLALFYLSPATIRDTAFLVYDYPEPDRDDAQWLYLPALRKTRRIAARDRGKNFLGTDMSYEDMKNETRVAIEDYRWKTLREEPCAEARCLVVDARPVDEETASEIGYQRITYWVDPEIWIARRAEYEDLAGRKKKTATLSEIRLVDGIWTVHRIEVVNHLSGHRTIFTSEDVDYASEVSEDWFTERALRRGVR